MARRSTHIFSRAVSVPSERGGFRMVMRKRGSFGTRMYAPEMSKLATAWLSKATVERKRRRPVYEGMCEEVRIASKFKRELPVAADGAAHHLPLEAV